ncbi:hypothetical protein [Flindersiella endophytica]
MVRRLAGVVAGLALLGTAGCGSPAITAAKVGHAVAPTFANLYSVQQSVRGLRVTPDSLHAKAACQRGGPETPDEGPGQDWTCAITWFKHGPEIAVVASYNLHVQANGCYTADGEGPIDLNGQPTVTAADGAIVTNPLWQFDGCFDITS